MSQVTAVDDLFGTHTAARSGARTDRPGERAQRPKAKTSPHDQQAIDLQDAQGLTVVTAVPVHVTSEA